MNIKLQAVLHTLKECFIMALTGLVVYAIIMYVPMQVIVVGIIAICLANMLYFWYRINLSKLQEKEEVWQGKARQAEFQRGLDTLPKF